MERVTVELDPPAHLKSGQTVTLLVSVRDLPPEMEGKKLNLKLTITGGARAKITGTHPFIENGAATVKFVIRPEVSGPARFLLRDTMDPLEQLFQPWEFSTVDPSPSPDESGEVEPSPEPKQDLPTPQRSGDATHAPGFETPVIRLAIDDEVLSDLAWNIDEEPEEPGEEDLPLESDEAVSPADVNLADVPETGSDERLPPVELEIIPPLPAEAAEEVRDAVVAPPPASEPTEPPAPEPIAMPELPTADTPPTEADSEPPSEPPPADKDEAETSGEFPFFAPADERPIDENPPPSKKPKRGLVALWITVGALLLFSSIPLWQRPGKTEGGDSNLVVELPPTATPAPIIDFETAIPDPGPTLPESTEQPPLLPAVVAANPTPPQLAPAPTPAPAPPPVSIESPAPVAAAPVACVWVNNSAFQAVHNGSQRWFVRCTDGRVSLCAPSSGIRPQGSGYVVDLNDCVPLPPGAGPAR